MRSDLLVPCALATLLTGCFNVISGDQEFVDQVAAFKVRGSVCAAAPVGGDGGTLAALEGTSHYRWLAYGALIGDIVTPAGFVRYNALNADAELLELARTTVAHAAQIDARDLPGHDAKLAFWINAYNALTLESAARAFAADPGFTVEQNAFAFFDNEIYVVGGVVLSLNQIENGIIRGDINHPAVYPLDDEKKDLLAALHDDIWGGAAPDPRFHFVINCASSSCPALLAQPLAADTLDSVLEEATSAFLHDDARGAGPNGVSQIFQFYFNDFDPAGGIDGFVSQYRPLSEVNTSLLLPYDWSLNLAP